MEMVEKYRWDRQRYNEVLRVLRERLPNLGEGKEGFAPPV